MAIMLKGMATCEVHGDYEWSHYVLEGSEAIFGRWDDLTKNCVECYKQNGVLR